MSKTYNLRVSDPADTSRHGELWSSNDLDTLETMFKRGAGLHEIATALRRRADAVAIKMMRRGMLELNGEGTACPTAEWATRLARHANFAQLSKETAMTTTANIMITIITQETKTLINGVDGTTLSDDELLSHIAKMEQQIETWNKIKRQPNKLATRIREMENAIDALANYIDNRA